MVPQDGATVDGRRKALVSQSQITVFIMLVSETQFDQGHF